MVAKKNEKFGPVIQKRSAIECNIADIGIYKVSKQMKAHITIFISWLIMLTVAFSQNTGEQTAREMLESIFKPMSVVDGKFRFTTGSEGRRYLLEIDNLEPRVTNYDEIVELPHDFLTVSFATRHLSFTLNKIQGKDGLYEICKNVDLRPFGGELTCSTKWFISEGNKIIEVKKRFKDEVEAKAQFIVSMAIKYETDEMLQLLHSNEPGGAWKIAESAKLQFGKIDPKKIKLGRMERNNKKNTVKIRIVEPIKVELEFSVNENSSEKLHLQAITSGNH